MDAQAYCGRLASWNCARTWPVYGEIVAGLASLLWVAAVPHLWWVDTFTGAAASLLTCTTGVRVGGLTLRFFLLDCL